MSRTLIVDLLEQGLSDRAVARQVHKRTSHIAAIRAELGLPKAQTPNMNHPTLEAAFYARTKPAGNGHLAWTGHRQDATPAFKHQGRKHFAARVAFTIRHNRQPEGVCQPSCDMPGCIAPDHIDDTAARLRDRKALRYLNGMAAQPAECFRGHDQAEHGRLHADGIAYCQACKQLRKEAA